MTRRVFVWRDGKFLELGIDTQVLPKTKAHSVIQDTMPATWHPCDGRTYDSKSAFRAATRASGGVEVGNEKITPGQRQKLPPVRESIKESLQKLEQRPREIPIERISDWMKDK